MGRNVRKRTAKSQTLGQAVRDHLSVFVPRLHELHRRAHGVEAQYQAVWMSPVDQASLDAVFAPVERSLARDYAAVVGSKVEEVTTDDIERLLRAIGDLARACGVDLDTAPPRHRVKVWTRDYATSPIFDEVERDRDGRFRAAGMSAPRRFVVRKDVRLADDGSLLA